jgi:hypothetical protein
MIDGDRTMSNIHRLVFTAPSITSQKNLGQCIRGNQSNFAAIGKIGKRLSSFLEYL